MIRHMVSLAALALPAAAMAQAEAPRGAIDDQTAEYVACHSCKGDTNEIVVADFTIDYVIVVEAGALAPVESDRVQSTERIYAGAGVGTRVENILRDVAGLAQFRRSDGRSAHPTSQGVTLRGLGGNASSRAIVLLDNIPQADPFGGWIAWSSFDAVNLGGILLTRGGGSGVDGPGALAGTIALYSEIDNGAEASAAYGSRDSYDLSANAGGDLGRGSIGIDARLVGGDGFIPVVAAQRGSVDRAAGYQQGGGGIRLRTETGNDGRIEATVRGFFDRRDRGTDFSRSKVDGVDASVRYIHDRPGGWQASALTYVQIRDFDTGFASVAAGRGSVAPALYQHVPATGLGARFELRPVVAREYPLRLGVDWRRTTGRTEEDFFFTGLVPGRHRIAGGSSDTLGAFAEWTQGRANQGLLWTLSTRLDRWWIGQGYRLENNIGGTIRSDDRFAARQGWEASGRAGVRAEVGSGIALRAATYTDWRLPTLNELYRPFRVGADATAANELLRPERLYGGEVGAEFRADDVNFGVTLFKNRLDHAIANVTLANGPGTFPGVGFVPAGATYSQRLNVDAINSQGIEISGNVTFGDLALGGTFANIDARVKASGLAATLDGRRPAQVARNSGSATLTYAPGTLRISATLRYVGAQNEDDLGAQKLADALTADAAIAWSITEQLSLEARGENLFDALVPAALSASGILERAAPRTLWVGARFNF